MHAQFSSKVLDNPFGQMVFLNGSIGETSNFPRLNGTGKVIVNLEGVNGINSSGVVQLLKWFDSLRSFKSVVLRRCTPAMMKTLGLISASLPTNVSVESFFAPFIHEDTDERKDILFQLGSEYDQSGNVTATLIMEIDGKPFQLDATPELYFAILRRRQ